MFSGTIFFISLVIYFGLAFGYTVYLNSNLQKLRGQAAVFSQQIPAEDQKRIVNFYSQIYNLKTALAKHIFSSQLFSSLERNTQVNIYFNKFNLNTQTNQLALGGVAKTMDDINQQFVLFQSQPEVARVAPGNISFSEGVWRFEATLLFQEGYFSRSGLAAATTTQP